MTSKHYASWALGRARKRAWKRRSETLAAIAAPFGAFFGAALLSIAITPGSDYAAPMALVAAYAGAIALVLLVGAGIAATKAAL